jgi:hypothetical protein
VSFQRRFMILEPLVCSSYEIDSVAFKLWIVFLFQLFRNIAIYGEVLGFVNSKQVFVIARFEF